MNKTKEQNIEEYPEEIWANIYNPIYPDSWDLYPTEKSAVINSIGAKTHRYVHESLLEYAQQFKSKVGLQWSEEDKYEFALKWFKQGALDVTEPGTLFEDGIEADFYTAYKDQFPDPDESGQRTPADDAVEFAASWIDDSISIMQLNIGRLEVNCFDEYSEMSVKVGSSRYQSLTIDEAKELASFIISHIKNETEANNNDTRFKQTL